VSFDLKGTGEGEAGICPLEGLAAGSGGRVLCLGFSIWQLCLYPGGARVVHAQLLMMQQAGALLTDRQHLVAAGLQALPV
jgi:hypothetical protein